MRLDKCQRLIMKHADRGLSQAWVLPSSVAHAQLMFLISSIEWVLFCLRDQADETDAPSKSWSDYHNTAERTTPTKQGFVIYLVSKRNCEKLPNAK